MNHYKTEKATPLGVAFFKSRKWGESLLFSILFLFFLSACTGKKEKHSALPELQTLTFGLMPSFDGLPSLVAVRQGIYDSLDIKIDFITYASATDRDAAFYRGNWMVCSPTTRVQLCCRQKEAAYVWLWNRWQPQSDSK